MRGRSEAPYCFLWAQGQAAVEWRVTLLLVGGVHAPEQRRSWRTMKKQLERFIANSRVGVKTTTFSTGPTLWSPAQSLDCPASHVLRQYSTFWLLLVVKKSNRCRTDTNKLWSLFLRDGFHYALNAYISDCTRMNTTQVIKGQRGCKIAGQYILVEPNRKNHKEKPNVQPNEPKSYVLCLNMVPGVIYVLRFSVITWKPLTADISDTGHLAAVKYSDGKSWIVTFELIMRILELSRTLITDTHFAYYSQLQLDSY